MSTSWSNLAKVVYYRTYSRHDTDKQENWKDTVERVIRGNVRNHKVSPGEIKTLERLMLRRKAGPAGRGYWFSGSPGHEPLGGVALSNCWATTAEDWMNFVLSQDLLMLGGGVGMSVEHRFTSQLPMVKRDVSVTHRPTKDADFIVPDSREGWNELLRRLLEAFFVTGKSFSYSTVCIRPAGELIKSFGGKASGPGPLITLAEKASAILNSRAGKKVRPIDAADILCCIGEMVVSGNVRRSALIIIGDPFDKDLLKAKRWDLGAVPNQRAKANFTVVVDDVEDLHPLFWKTYEFGEPFGIINRTNIQKYGRMGELKKDTAILVNPCVPGNTEILTRTGYARIDSLLAAPVEVWNGFEWSTVQPKITGYNQPMVTVELSSGQSLVCTEAHMFVVSTDYRGGTKRVKAADLTPDMKLIKAAFPVLSGGESPDVDAYTQGFFSGDGSDGTKSFGLYGKEKLAVAPRLDGWLGNYNPAQDKTPFTPTKVNRNKKFLPMSWNLQGKLDWLAGVIDSDGTELKEGGTQIGSIHKDFLLGIQKMLTTMGVASKVSLMCKSGDRLLPDGSGGVKLYPCQDCFRLLIGAVQMQDLKRYGYRGSRLTFDKTPQRDASQFVKVLSVSPAGTEKVVYCFEEPKRHLGCFDGVVTGQCGEATLEGGAKKAEGCNLQNIPLQNIADEDEFVLAATMMHRWGRRVTTEKYHWEGSDEIIKRNRRVGTSVTGCLRSPLWNPKTLDRAYEAIQDENRRYSKAHNEPESIRTTTIQPGGTLSKVYDCDGYEGIHPAWSRHSIQRIRFSASDLLVPKLQAAGHYVEPVIQFDGTTDSGTVVVDFPQRAPKGYPVADEDWNTWKQLDTLLMAQKHWSDQAVSVTVYYKREEIPQLKIWLAEHLKDIKSISFLCHSDHGFRQAPKEAITEEKYAKMVGSIKPIEIDGDIGNATDLLEGLECAGGSCPTR